MASERALTPAVVVTVVLCVGERAYGGVGVGASRYAGMAVVPRSVNGLVRRETDYPAHAVTCPLDL